MQAHARKAEQEANVQHIVDKETAGLQVCCARRIIITSCIAKTTSDLQVEPSNTYYFIVSSFLRDTYLSGHWSAGFVRLQLNF